MAHEVGATVKLEHSHAVTPGKSLIEKIQERLDNELAQGDPSKAEGIAIALGVMRSSSTEHELECALKRTGLEWDDDDDK